MALEDMKESQKPEGALTDEEEQDLGIAILLAEKLMDEGGYDVIEEARQSSDPAQVIGQFFVQMIVKMYEDMPTQTQLSKRIWLAEGGWVEQVMDALVTDETIDKKTADRAEVYIAQAFQQMGQASTQQQGAPAPAGAAPAAAPTMPQGGMPV